MPPRRRNATLFEVLGPALILAVLGLVALLAWLTPQADANTITAARPEWSSALATWYGPGFYGRSLACADHYPAGQPGPRVLKTTTLGVAHRTLPCGTYVTFRYGTESIRVRVIDRGPYSGATWDLTGATAVRLLGAKPFTTTVQWRLS